MMTAATCAQNAPSAEISDDESGKSTNCIESGNIHDQISCAD
jgi:hypothetical protein